MKAAILNGYHQEVVIQDIPLPSMGDEDVLVKIKAAGVNPLDNMIIRGDVKLIVPYKFPLVMGNEFVGVIERIGSNVSKFSVGERVYGRMPLKRIGAFAEYAAIDQNAVAKAPDYHMTNLRYIDMFQDAYDAAFWKAFDPTEMEISFFSQCREGEELTILSREEESAVYLAALHADGKLASAALFNKSHKNNPVS